MSTQDLVAPSPVDLGRAEAALVEHYPRLVRIAYLVLPPSLERGRRVLTAHALVQRSLPRRKDAAAGVPGARRAEDAGDPGYAFLRAQVLRQALEAGGPRGRLGLPRRAQLPPLLPRVWGLRLAPRAGGTDEMALDQRLGGLSGAARAVVVLRGLERQGDPEVLRVLAAAGVAQPKRALAEANRVAVPHGLLESAEFDPCSLRARPTDLRRRRQHTRAGLAALAAAVVCAGLLGLPGGGGWGPDGAAAPPYARNPVSEAALNPANVRKVAASAWRKSPRTDFTVWPARGESRGDQELLRRALAVWARPGGSVQASATPGTLPGPPMGPPQLLFAGVVDRARVVLFHDGLRVVRYAEPKDGSAGAALDFARTDGADMAGAEALVVGRVNANVRYLTAPWVREASVRDLLDPAAGPRPLPRDARGVTDALVSPVAVSTCKGWDALELRDEEATRTLSDLGEIVPARLTSGPPAERTDVTGTSARKEWSRTACLLPAVRAQGVRSVNSWRFAQQELPESGGRASWVCTRAETWRGAGTTVVAQFQAPGAKPGAPGAVAAKAVDSLACGEREARVLAGVLWQSPERKNWYLVAAGSAGVASLTVTGGVEGESDMRLLTVATDRAAAARAKLTGTLEDGTEAEALH
ncbi:hypothetical protein NX801_11475 [Streptomyces sp. LP05-1]|uniref:DNA-directed RNA polymerase specialized sigma24 family protein n=1 Tax=Streptomyces pyxinae TaxID=2970734 RepID=A0ABT2CFT1_9ACTN|nr:hypothetical protein [Streptomyces sp. LP05-1]MCS0636269.1 hypothetical protein [Streptomyces sp. LP05-1]